MGGLANPAVLGLMAGGTVTSAVGQAMTGKAQERAARFNAEVIQRENDMRLSAMHNQARRRRSQNIVATAKSGVRLSGSPLAVLEENEYQESQQRDYARQAAQLGSELQRMQGRSARQAASYGVASEILSGAGLMGARALRHA